MLKLLKNKAQTKPKMLAAFLIAISFAPVSLAKAETKSSQGVPAIVNGALGYARFWFRQGEYNKALLILKDYQGGEVDALWIKAESNFRVNNFNEAIKNFSQLKSLEKDSIAQRKIDIRIFDCHLGLGNVQKAVDLFGAYKKTFKKPPAKMRYNLGKALHDRGYHKQAVTILRLIPKNSEFYLRARYIVASFNIEKVSAKNAINRFRAIEKFKPISVEDYTVNKLAILAQARIYGEKGRYDLMQKTYERLPMIEPFASLATAEQVERFLLRADEARTNSGRYSRSSKVIRVDAERQALKNAFAAIEKYRRHFVIDWRKPKLMNLVAELLGRSKRYDEAKEIFAELIGHYRGVQNELSKMKDDEQWPVFQLNFGKDVLAPENAPLVSGVAESWASRFKEVAEIFELKAQIEKNRRAIEDKLILARRYKNEKALEILTRASLKQKGIETSFVSLALKKQIEIKQLVIKEIDTNLASAEYAQAKVGMHEIMGVKKQLDYVRAYETNQTEKFENKLEPLEIGGES